MYACFARESRNVGARVRTEWFRVQQTVIVYAEVLGADRNAQNVHKWCVFIIYVYAPRAGNACSHRIFSPLAEVEHRLRKTFVCCATCPRSMCPVRVRTTSTWPRERYFCVAKNRLYATVLYRGYTREPRHHGWGGGGYSDSPPSFNGWVRVRFSAERYDLKTIFSVNILNSTLISWSVRKLLLRYRCSSLPLLGLCDYFQRMIHNGKWLFIDQCSVVRTIEMSSKF